jgi:hypothetical protein
MAYPQTLTDLQNDVLSRLQEASNSTAGDLVSGTGAASTTSTAATITQYLNEASADLARYAWPIWDSGTYTLPASTLSVTFESLTVADGNVMWAARDVSWNGTPLTYFRQSALESWYQTTFPTDTGTPLWWAEQGQAGIIVYPTPSTQQALTVYGLAVPKQLSSGSDVPSWFGPDQVKLVVFNAAARLALKNAEDATLTIRDMPWWNEWERGKEALLTRLWQEDPLLAQAHFPKPAG